MKKWAFAAFLAAVSCLPASVFGAWAGTTSVFDIGTSVRAQSLGGAFSSVDGDAGCVYYNPAALNSLGRLEFQAAYIPLFFETYYTYVLAAIPTMDIGTFAVSAAAIGTGDITLRDETGVDVGTSDEGIYEGIVGWAKEFFDDRLFLGAAFKFDYHNVEAYANDASFSLDIGSFYTFINDREQKLNAGLVLKNAVEPQLNLGTGSEKIPRQLFGSVTYTRVITPDISLTGLLDMNVPFGSEFDLRAGVECSLYSMVYLRGGWNSYNLFSLGAGIRVMDMVRIDYGMFFSEIYLQHRVGLSAQFGGNVPEARARRAELEEAKVEKKAKELAAKELAQLRDKIDRMTGSVREKEQFKALHYSRALTLYYEGDLKDSYAEFETVYKVDSGYMSVAYYYGFVGGLIKKGRDQAYSEPVLKLYREGVDRYLKQDYKGAKESWEAILKIDPYNKLALENLKEVNSLLRQIEGMEGEAGR